MGLGKGQKKIRFRVLFCVFIFFRRLPPSRVSCVPRLLRASFARKTRKELRLFCRLNFHWCKIKVLKKFTSTCKVIHEKGLIDEFKVVSNMLKRLRVSIFILLRGINAPVLSLLLWPFSYCISGRCTVWLDFLVRTHLVNLTSPFVLFRTFLSLTVIFVLVCFVKSPRRRSRSRSPSPKRGYRDHDKSRRRSRSPAHHRYMYTYMTMTRRLWAVYYL